MPDLKEVSDAELLRRLGSCLSRLSTTGQKWSGPAEDRLNEELWLIEEERYRRREKAE
jgi:hypothetical protein